LVLVLCSVVGLGVAGTFLGLARLLTSATSFEEALEMASWIAVICS